MLTPTHTYKNKHTHVMGCTHQRLVTCQGQWRGNHTSMRRSPGLG